VEPVHLVQCEEVDVLLHELLRLEVARDVEVRAAPAESRLVRDRRQWHAPLDVLRARFAKDLFGQQLPQRLDAVEHTGRRRRPNGDGPLGNREVVTLVRQPARKRRLQPQRDVRSLGRCSSPYCQVEAGRCLEHDRQPPAQAAQRLVDNDLSR
jgi:hypothetical protein